MSKAYLLLGSNQGDRLHYLEQARREIEQHLGQVVKQSQVYETAAWGVTDQQAFLNQILEIETKLAPEELLQGIMQAEQKLGRVRVVRWGERVIDIDILFYNDLVCRSQRLTIPHPELHNRRFTLVPLAEIAPDLKHPVFQTKIADLLQKCPDTLEVRPLPPAEADGKR